MSRIEQYAVALTERLCEILLIEPGELQERLVVLERTLNRIVHDHHGHTQTLKLINNENNRLRVNRLNDTARLDAILSYYAFAMGPVEAEDGTIKGRALIVIEGASDDCEAKEYSFEAGPREAIDAMMLDMAGDLGERQPG